MNFIKMELTTQFESMTLNGLKLAGEILNPHLIWAQEQMHPRLKRFLNWEHVASTGFLFTTMILSLSILRYFAVLSILSYTFLGLLMISSMFWLYTKCISVYQSDESERMEHPLKPYLERQMNISVTEIHRAADEVIKLVDIVFKRSKEIIFVDNLWVSAVAWSILLIVFFFFETNVSVLTVLIRAVVFLLIISLPFGYMEHKSTVDQLCIAVYKRIQHGKIHNCNNHEDHTAMEEGHKESLSEKLIMRFSSVMFLVRPELKMIYYLLTPMVISVFTSLLLFLFEVEIPHVEFLTGKRSVFNQWFVKFGWGWTLGLLLLFQICLISIYQNRWNYLRNVAVKTFFTTLFFYVWCQIIFPSIEEFTGECRYNEGIINISKHQCIKSPEHKYKSYFDISGHAFLMSYCVLILMQEAHHIQDLLKALRQPGKDEKLVPHAPQVAAPFVAISFILITVLSLLWDFMIIITMIYFHTFIEILLGVILAILMFMIIYEKILPYCLSL